MFIVLYVFISFLIFAFICYSAFHIIDKGGGLVSLFVLAIFATTIWMLVTNKFDTIDRNHKNKTFKNNLETDPYAILVSKGMISPDAENVKIIGDGVCEYWVDDNKFVVDLYNR